MAILSADKLVVVKAFAPANPLPLDAREIYESLAEARAYAATNATAYAGQTIKVVEDGVVTAYNLAPSTVEGENFCLQFSGGGAGGVQSISTCSTEGNISVAEVNGETTTTKDVPVVGVLVNPVVDDDAHTLTLTKIGATAEDNEEVVINLGGASPETIISGVAVASDGVSLDVTKFNVEEETSETVNVKLTGVAGTVTGIVTSTAGTVTVTTMQADGTATPTSYALVGACINPQYVDGVLTLQKVTGITDGNPTFDTVTLDMTAATAGFFNSVSTIEETADKSAGYSFGYRDASGDLAETTVYETGVRKVEAGSTADKIKVTTADKTGALSAAEILVGAGSVKNPTYDAETRKITLPVLQADGTTQNVEINLGKDMVVTSGVYNTETQEIELTLTDGSVVKIPAANLVDVYTGGETETVTVAVSEDNVITASVKVSTTLGNVLKVDADGGLIVHEDDFTQVWNSISTLSTKVGDLGESADVPAYVAAQIEAASTKWVDFGSEVTE